MENDRSLKVDVAVKGYRDEDGKYYTLSYNVDTSNSVEIVAGVDQNGKGHTLPIVLEDEIEDTKFIHTESDSSKPIEVKDISEVLSGDMSDNTIITTPRGVIKTAGQIREEARNFTYENSPLANKVKSKRIEAIEFLTKKDSKRYDFKALLRDCLKGYKHSVETIRAIYKIRVLNKEFKHLNANSKRIALNDYLSNKFIEHSAETNESTIDLIALLKNDNNLIDYAVLLKRVLVMAINRKIKLY